ncbi:hypothetical protein V3C10_07195 [[Clostridium] symbiosum]|uniref:hypothetical protein n=1 Tax=Clostridium symbiosum TaxID=1512 RepID=UPI001D07DCF6|nr:hypothetical protein [[Clostridium] symbiosum]MCB6607158.1 hypothetical protein [[Clostridium] symbiosum]MCB6929718.1 hypothetical protein [[Clostridium] symbiosum]
MALLRKLFKKKEDSSRQETGFQNDNVIMGFVLLKTPEIEERKLTEAILYGSGSQNGQDKRADGFWISRCLYLQYPSGTGNSLPTVIFDSD